MSKALTGDLGNSQDNEKLNSAMDGKGSSDFIKIEVGKNYLYLLSKNYKAAFTHWIPAGGKSGKAFVCLGGLDRKGYAPDVCPACEQAQKFYAMKKKAVKQKDKDFYNKCGNTFHARLVVFMVAVKGFAVREKVNGETITTFGCEDDAAPQFLRLTEKQWAQIVGRKADATSNKKEVQGLMEKYPFLLGKDGKPDWNNLTNRPMVFEKDAGDFGETTITPSKRTAPKPEFAEMPTLDDAIPSDSKDDMVIAIEAYNEATGESEEDSGDDLKEKKPKSMLEKESLDDDDDGVEPASEEEVKKSKAESKKPAEKESADPFSSDEAF